MQLHSVKSPGGNAYALSNIVAVSPLDFKDRDDFYILVDGQFVLTARATEGCRPGEIGFTDAQRTWMSIGLGPSETVQVRHYEMFSDGAKGYLGNTDVQLGFASKKTTEAPYDQEQLQDLFTRASCIYAPTRLWLTPNTRPSRINTSLQGK
jgi:vesicle-fusing ATPase